MTSVPAPPCETALLEQSAAAPMPPVPHRIVGAVGTQTFEGAVLSRAAGQKVRALAIAYIDLAQRCQAAGTPEDRQTELRTLRALERLVFSAVRDGPLHRERHNELMAIGARLDHNKRSPNGETTD